jgi:hypothetical protein
MESASKLKHAVYEPVPPPQYLPIDFGESSRIQHQINVALTALCNCKQLKYMEYKSEWGLTFP